MTLIDANVLVYAVNASAPQHRASRAAVEAAMAGTLFAVLVPQVLLEFFAVVTNPRRVTHPLDPRTAWEQVEALRGNLRVLDVYATTLDALQELVQTTNVSGGRIFDLFLVAQMRQHRIDTICTYNTADFADFAGIKAVAPEALLTEVNG